MNSDLYRLAAPGRDAMLKELDRILTGRQVDSTEIATQQLAIHLQCIVGAFVTSCGLPARDATTIVHAALGHLVASAASNLRVWLPGMEPTLANSFNVTVTELTRRGLEAVRREQTDCADAVIPMEIGEDGALRPKPFDLASMLKGRAP